MTSSKYFVTETPSSISSVGDYSYDPSPCSPQVITNYTDQKQSLLEKKLKLYESVIEYFFSLLSKEDKDSLKNLFDLLKSINNN